MNNYLKLLLHLKQFDGDGKLHPVENLFSDISINDLKSILEELSEEGLIKYTGHEERYLSFILEQNIFTNKTKITESPLNEHVLNSEPDQFKAKITFKGSKYLKEELQMQESGKYNINVSGQGANNTFVIESNNVTIENKPDFRIKIEEIIDILKSDKTIDTELRVKAISDLTEAKEQVNNTGKLPEKLMKGILQYGSQISSIGSLLCNLFGT